MSAHTPLDLSLFAEHGAMINRVEVYEREQLHDSPASYTSQAHRGSDLALQCNQ